MTVSPWAAAVASACAGRRPAARAVIRDELIALWADLNDTVGEAFGGRSTVWSGECDILAARIIRLSRAAGATPWQQVPARMLTSGIYQGLMTDAGIRHGEPSAKQMGELHV